MQDSTQSVQNSLLSEENLSKGVQNSPLNVQNTPQSGNKWMIYFVLHYVSIIECDFRFWSYQKVIIKFDNSKIRAALLKNTVTQAYVHIEMQSYIQTCQHPYTLD